MWLAALAMACAFLFLGSRGLYDPDEGRYTNVALQMLHSGDWVEPRRNDDTGHWTKPPLTYWTIAASIGTFGSTAWAARLPMALAYLACALLCWRSARLIAPGRENLAALAYLSMLMPFLASQLVTTDFLLAAFQALAVYAYVESRFRDQGPGVWPWVMWAAFGLAFLTKGPPALLPLLAIALVSWLAPAPRPMRMTQMVGGLALFLAIVLPWFVVVSYENKGLLRYFLGAEVIDRVASDRFSRHGEWYGWAEVYVPTLLLGTMPWTLRLFAWARSLPDAIRRWFEPAARSREAGALLLAVWILLPLLVFCIARSRLPLYLLPLFVPLALLVAQQAPTGDLSKLSWRAMGTWALVLLSLRLASAMYSSDQDASAWATAIRAQVDGPVREVVFVEDMPRYGLRLYLDTEVETLSLDDIEQPAYNPAFDESLAVELAEGANETGVVYVAKQKIWPAVTERIIAHGFRPMVAGQPFHGRVIFRVVAEKDRPPELPAKPRQGPSPAEG